MIPWETQQQADINKVKKQHIDKQHALLMNIDFFEMIYKMYCKALHGKIFHRALEIGPSVTGGYLSVIPGITYRTAIDSLADELLKQDMLPLTSHIRYVQGFSEALPFKDKTFNLVIISNTLDHVKDMKKSVEEIGRVLTDGGYVFFATYLKVKNPHPFTFNSVDEARDMFNKFELVEEHHIIPDRPFNRRNEQYVGIFRKL